MYTECTINAYIIVNFVVNGHLKSCQLTCSSQKVLSQIYTFMYMHRFMYLFNSLNQAKFGCQPYNFLPFCVYGIPKCELSKLNTCE